LGGGGGEFALDWRWKNLVKFPANRQKVNICLHEVTQTNTHVYIYNRYELR